MRDKITKYAVENLNYEERGKAAVKCYTKESNQKEEQIMEWQLIETAPKDKRILLFCPDLGIMCGQYNADQYTKEPRPYWSSDYERLFGVRSVRGDQPTHWMPLPDDPK